PGRIREPMGRCYPADLIVKFRAMLYVNFSPTDNLQLLYMGITKNGFDNVRVMPFAASNRVEIFSLDGGTSNTYLVAPEDGKNYVQSVILDELLNDLPVINVVKIDIEGHEPYAIEGFRSLLGLHKPVVLLEFNPYYLSNFSVVSPQEFLRQIFGILEDVYVVEHSGTQSAFQSAEEVWQHWKNKNEEAVKANLLPDGLLHFEILAKAK
ncbi:MAG: FkbM family methyltransferase, partial [Chloroflexi bacterium]|nr:FkbM family methyltransferase [Chloroflexota bacterium]MCI0730559.1 FkbM family methyltransferase [Chloroflexota bacterium]